MKRLILLLLSIFMFICILYACTEISSDKCVACEYVELIDSRDTEPAPLEPLPEITTTYDTYAITTETTLAFPDIKEPEPEYDIKESDITILAKLLYGECRGVESKQEQAAVIWCVLNRVDSTDNYYPDTIKGVVTQKGHFTGYKNSNPVWPEFKELAEDVLTRWYREKDGEINVGRVLPKDYLWFHGNGTNNIFRNAYKSKQGNKWNWSYTNPYSN